MKILLSLIALLLPILSAQGLTLKEAKELAEKNYPKLKALREEVRESSLSAEVSRRERFGEVDSVGSYTSYNRNYILVPMFHPPNPLNPPPFDSRKLTYGISLKIPLYLGGVISRKVELNEVKEELLKNSLKAATWQVKLNAATLFLKILSLSEREKALKEHLKSLEKLYENTKAGVEVGKLAPVDLMKIGYSLREVEARLKEVREMEKALLTALETLLGQKVKDLQPPHFSYQPKEWKIGEFYSELLEKNSRIKAAERRVELSKVKEKLTKAKYGVKFTVNGLLTRRYGFDSGENEAYSSISLNLSFPIFTGGRKGLELLQRESEVRRALYEQETVKRELKRELAEVVALLNSIQERLKADKEKLKLAKEVERIEELKYVSGKGDINHLLLAKAQRFESQADLNASYYEWFSALERLKALLEVNNE
ncbi:MAG: TolC family protein [Desulfurobacteriaceae bacterium]